MRRAAERHLECEGCFNVRDLGGLRTAGGGETRWGAVVRADALDDLTAAGWQALRAHGVRTVVDLRNDDERGPDAAPRPAGVATIHLPLDGDEERDFWDVWGSGPQFGTPLYYGPHLDRFPARCAARGEEDQRPLLEAFLADRGTTAGEVIVGTLAEIDVGERLRGAGLAEDDVAALRRRLINAG